MQRHFKFLILHSCLLWMASCATSPPERYKLNEQGSEHPAISLMIGGMSDNHRFVVDGSIACREVYAFRKVNSHFRLQLVEQQRVTHSADQSQVFWHEIEHLQVSLWKERYDRADISVTIYDGTQWSLEYSTPSKMLSFSGDNAYPRAGTPGLTTLKSTAVDQLVTAFSRLFPTPMEEFMK